MIQKGSSRYSANGILLSLITPLKNVDLIKLPGLDNLTVKVRRNIFQHDGIHLIKNTQNYLRTKGFKKLKYRTKLNDQINDLFASLASRQQVKYQQISGYFFYDVLWTVQFTIPYIKIKKLIFNQNEFVSFNWTEKRIDLKIAGKWIVG